MNFLASTPISHADTRPSQVVDDAMNGIDEQLLTFRRQYLQLLEPDFLSWPPKQLLQDSNSQQWISRNLFSTDINTYLPSERYRFRVLKDLITKIERAIEDPDEHVGYSLLIVPEGGRAVCTARTLVDRFDQEVCEDLMSHFSSLLSSSIPSELIAAQQRSYVTYCPGSNPGNDGDNEQITILERRNLISGSQTTGFRTWEAALHLSAYLWNKHGHSIVAGKNILELGAGTGLLSLLCAKYLGADSVVATDGDDAVVEALTETAILNGLDLTGNLRSSVFKWGHALQKLYPEDDSEPRNFDVVLGADIIYDKTAISPLVATLSMLFESNHQCQILMASAVRNESTFNTFLQACSRQAFNMKEIEFNGRPMRQQTGLFYATAMPLKILQITPRSAEREAQD